MGNGEWERERGNEGKETRRGRDKGIFFFSLSPPLLVSLSLLPASHFQLIISQFAVLVFNSVSAGRSLEEGLHPLGKRLSSEIHRTVCDKSWPLGREVVQIQIGGC